MLLIPQIVLFLVISMNVYGGLPSLSNESKENFDQSRKILEDVQKEIRKVINSMEGLGKDYQKADWHKYNGHCYHYSGKKEDWFTAVRKCSEMGAYLVKVDNAEENDRLAKNRTSSSVHYWLGLSDVKEGHFRWTYDQSKATFTTFHSGYGAKGTSRNCVRLYKSSKQWTDSNCDKKENYICESNFCF